MNYSRPYQLYELFSYIKKLQRCLIQGNVQCLRSCEGKRCKERSDRTRHGFHLPNFDFWNKWNFVVVWQLRRTGSNVTGLTKRALHHWDKDTHPRQDSPPNAKSINFSSGTGLITLDRGTSCVKYHQRPHGRENTPRVDLDSKLLFAS